jgi:hypothetical protein
MFTLTTAGKNYQFLIGVMSATSKHNYFVRQDVTTEKKRKKNYSSQNEVIDILQAAD